MNEAHAARVAEITAVVCSYFEGGVPSVDAGPAARERYPLVMDAVRAAAAYPIYHAQDIVQERLEDPWIKQNFHLDIADAVWRRTSNSDRIEYIRKRIADIPPKPWGFGDRP